MNVLGLLQDVGQGINKGSQFGKKGLIGGIGIGLTGYALGETVENNTKDDNGNTTNKGAIIGGIVSGSFASGISSAYEIYTQNHPYSIPAFHSVETSGDTHAKVSFNGSYLSPSTYMKIYNDAKNNITSDMKAPEKIKQYINSATKEFSSNYFKPEKLITDITKYSMFTNQDTPIKGFNNIFKALEKGHSITDIATTPIKFAKMAVDETVGAVNNYDRNNSKWLGDGSKTPLNSNIDSDMPVNERIAEYIKTNKDTYNNILDRLDDKLHIRKNSNMKNADDLINYYLTLKPGAIGKTEMFERDFYKNPETNTVTKVVAALDEIMSGSPLYARTLRKQENSYKVIEGKLKPMVEVTEKDGKKIIKDLGHGKIGRELALAGDVALGGIATAATFELLHLTSSILHSNKDKNTNTVDTNKAK